MGHSQSPMRTGDLEFWTTSFGFRDVFESLWSYLFGIPGLKIAPFDSRPPEHSLWNSSAVLPADKNFSQTRAFRAPQSPVLSHAWPFERPPNI